MQRTLGVARFGKELAQVLRRFGVTGHVKGEALTLLKQYDKMSTYIDFATAERQLVVPGTSCASMEQVNASASGNKHAARASASARTAGPESSRMMQVLQQCVEITWQFERPYLFRGFAARHCAAAASACAKAGLLCTQCGTDRNY